MAEPPKGDEPPANEPPKPPANEPPKGEPPKGEPDNETTRNKSNKPWQFAKGNKFTPPVPNPSAGSRHRFLRLIDDITQAASTGIANKLIEAAKAGDPTAIRTFHEWYIPKPRASRLYVDEYKLAKPTSSADAAERLAQVVADVASGAVDTERGALIITGLRTYLDADRQTELERRIAQLEQGEDGASE
jgi:hypothetical protein